ncbi:hypothetical protein LCGC14_0394160 [marine sediment metagenome]|uniref:Zinc/iron-chelating domain-containing protein n=1 Tax=marine sediment metagenome TaxID=412755 RepID=A0A0F9VKP4_9ZZZZ
MVITYKCEGCGACCTVNNPFTGLERCPKLTEDNRCSIYATRPDMCRSRKVADALGLTDEEYDELANGSRRFLRELVYGGDVNPTPLSGGIKDAVAS